MFEPRCYSPNSTPASVPQFPILSSPRPVVYYKYSCSSPNTPNPSRLTHLPLPFLTSPTSYSIMKLSIFSSLAVAVALVQTASAQTSPKPDPNPINYSNADYLSNSNVLVVSGGEHHDPTPTANVTLLKSLRFLNLAKDWPKTQPLWSGKGPLTTGQKEPEVGPIGLDKDGVKVYLFGPKQHQIYNLQSNVFEPAVNYTKTSFHPQKHTFTDPTSGYIYGLSCVGAKGTPGTSPRCSMASFNPTNGNGTQLAQGPADLDPLSRGVYSKTTKSVFYYPYNLSSKLYAYNIESNTWTTVVRKDLL